MRWPKASVSTVSGPWVTTSVVPTTTWPLSQGTHDVARDGGRRYVSRQNVFWPELLDVLEHKLTTSRRARFAQEPNGGANVAQSGTAEHSANAVRNEVVGCDSAPP